MASTILKLEDFNAGTWTHKCRVFPTKGMVHLPYYDAVAGNIFTPAKITQENLQVPPGGWNLAEDWVFWYQHAPNEPTINEQLHQPEAHHIEAANNPTRVYAGARSYCWFGFSRRVCGGIVCNVPTIVGQKVRLSFWAHGWSNQKDDNAYECWKCSYTVTIPTGKDSAVCPRCGTALNRTVRKMFPHPDDAKWSEWAGYDERRVAWASVPTLNGNGQNDAAGNIMFRAGLDPAGTGDLWSSTLVWGDGQCVYNDYQSPQIVCETVATGPQMSVWVSGQALWAFKHNDFYIDELVVEVIEEPEPPEPPEECRGEPRVQYNRIYNVVPNGATEDQAAAIFLEGWRRSHETTGGSYDDAGVGDLDSRTANLYGIPDTDQQAFIDFYETWYPDVVVKFLPMPDEPEPPDDILLWQQDPLWKDEHHGGPACTTTIGTDGCFDTCLAMAQRWFKVKTDATPLTVQKTIEPDGYTVCKTNWAAIDAKLGMTITGATEQQARDAISAGSVALADVIFGDDMHFVMAVNWLQKPDGKIDYYIYDPWLYQEGWMSELRPSGAESWRILVKQDQPQPPVPPKFNPRVLALHLQSNVEASQRYVSTCKPSGIKLVQNAQDLPTYAALNPGMYCTYRGMGESDDPITFVNMHLATLTQVADMFEQRGLPKVDGKFFRWELWNEKNWDSNRANCIKQRDMEIAAIQYLAQKEPRVGVGAFCAGVGNIQPADFDVLVPLAQVVATNGGTFNLHSYFGATLTDCTMDNYEAQGRWLQYRFEMTDDYLVAHGVKVNWFLSEGGTIYYEPPTNMPASTPGWKHPTCMNGNWARYLGYLEQLDQHFYQWNLAHEGRLKGYSLFTSGGGSEWRYFELGSAELDALAAMQVRLWPIS